MQDKAQTGNDLEWVREGLEARGGKKTVRGTVFRHEGKVEIWFEGGKKKTFRTHRQGPTFLAFQTAAGFCSPHKPINVFPTCLRSCLVLLVISTFCFQPGVTSASPLPRPSPFAFLSTLRWGLSSIYLAAIGSGTRWVRFGYCSYIVDRRGRYKVRAVSLLNAGLSVFFPVEICPTATVPVGPIPLPGLCHHVFRRSRG